MTTEFTSLNLRPELVQTVTALGYTEPTPIQAALIPVMLTGVDVIGQAQTGTGKTAAFALPILQNLQPNQRHVQALVLAPTRELALQVAEALGQYGKPAQGARAGRLWRTALQPADQPAQARRRHRGRHTRPPARPARAQSAPPGAT